MPNLDNSEALKEDALRLRTLIEMASDGIITIDHQGYIESVNSAASQLFGYTSEEMVGQKVNILMTKTDREQHDQYLQRYQHTKQASIIGIGREVIGQKKDGNTFPLRLAVSEVKLNGKVIYTGILHDLSEQKKAQSKIIQLNADLEQKVLTRTEELGNTLEKMLSANEALHTEMGHRKEVEQKLRKREEELETALNKERELNELKSRFVSMASHEFKTPLSTVLSSVELIEMYQTQSQQPKREKHIKKIKAAIRQLTDILNDFLSLSQLEQGKIKLAKKWIDTNAIIATSVEASEGQFKPGQEVELKIANQPQKIYGDPKMLQHVLMNLLYNAAKYSEAGQLITMETGQKANKNFIAVIDRGIGIPPSDQVHLFTRFFRARNVENIQGTGLGLNIVQHYMDLLGGEVTFKSKEGQGSTFTIWLPTNEKQTTDGNT